MHHLSALDALFLHLETPEMPMHVGSLILFEKPKGHRGSFYRGIRAHIEDRMHLAPLFSRRLAFVPLDLANPVWITGVEPDLDRHVRRLVLPKPGTQRQLESAVAKLHEGMLDRDLPLWEFTVIEGLQSRLVGFYSKIHHAALDGQGGVALAHAILDADPVGRAPGPAAKVDTTHPRPSAARMLGAAFRNTVAQYGRIARAIPSVVRLARDAASSLLSASEAELAGAPSEQGRGIPPLRGGGREDKLETIAKSLLNKPMVCAVPASLRAPDDTGHGNKVTMMLVNMATEIADPRRRLAAIVASSAKAKAITGGMKSVIPTDMPSLGVPWLMSAITPLYRMAVAANRIPVVANLVVSNVPGPQLPMYMAGARMRGYYPVSIVVHGLALNITILSYDGSMDYGLVACRTSVPRLREFARYMQAAHRELLDLVDADLSRSEAAA